jgi:two-component system, LytTR family, response regulator
MKITTIIAEDQKDARDGLELLLNKMQDFEIIGLAKNGIEAIEQINERKPDLLLLDIQMPGANGFEVLNSLDEAITPSVIFLTAFDEFAIKAFEVNAIDYILKPYTNERLSEALDKVKASLISQSLPKSIVEIKQLIRFYEHQKNNGLNNSHITETDSKRFIIKELGKINIVNFKDLFWVEAFDYYSKLHTTKGTFLIRKPMKEIEAELPEEFIRIHRSFIVRIDQISQIRKDTYGGTVFLNNDINLSVSRRYWKKMKANLQSPCFHKTNTLNKVVKS